ncbi:ribonuclease HII [Candidatus Pacearchaeota archaeon CG10_big_fil_rev_8_21_14_0_10_32_42]|nr:MAG: ribonuclease HII [Candidatus Pacearchaeota archaeon CG10_big_fil_rev_8_21_14_0_10_32_42]
MVELILGLDEAGKGPVIGPMIIAGCLIEKKDESSLRRLEVKDSKLVTKKRREYLEEEIKKVVRSFEIVICEAEEIDSTNSAGINLIELEARKFAEIINKLNKGTEKIKIIIDCPSIGIKSWTDQLKTKIKNLSNLEFVIEHKADVNYLAVAAASILAKCERERKMDLLKEKYGNEIGSGYCADPLTMKFVEKFALKFGKEGLFRNSWATWKNACIKLKQVELEF